jgi:hypothetical protein
MNFKNAKTAYIVEQLFKSYCLRETASRALNPDHIAANSNVIGNGIFAQVF